MLYIFRICQVPELLRTNVFCGFLGGGLTSFQVNRQPTTASQVPKLSTVGPGNRSHGNLQSNRSAQPVIRGHNRKIGKETLAALVHDATERGGTDY